MTETDLEFDLFLEAFEEYQKAKHKLDRERERRTPGDSFGVSGDELFDSVDRCKTSLRAAFSRIVAGAARKEKGEAK